MKKYRPCITISAIMTALLTITCLIASCGEQDQPTGMSGKPENTEKEGQIIVKQSGGAGILIAECADKSYITEQADYIIEGTVEKVEIRWNDEKTNIFTYSDLRIEKYVKGEPFAEDTLQIITPGGTVGGVGVWVEDQPIFHEGKRVRIYFKEINGEFSIVCAQTGVEEAEKNPEHADLVSKMDTSVAGAY